MVSRRLTSTAPDYYTALKFTSNSSFTAAQRPTRILAISEGIFYGRAAADEIFSGGGVSAATGWVRTGDAMSGWFWLGSRSTLRPTVGGARARPSGWRWSSNPSISSLAVCKFQPVWIPCWSVARPTRWCGCDLVGWVIRFSYDLNLN